MGCDYFKSVFVLCFLYRSQGKVYKSVQNLNGRYKHQYRLPPIMSDGNLASQMQFYNSNDSTEKYNDGIVRNNRIFIGIFVAMEILFMFMYGFYIRPVGYIPQSQAMGSQTYALFLAIGVGSLVLIGFGLVFGYMRFMSFSGIGFTFLITCITYQYYFLINGFWANANIQISTLNFQGDHIVPVRLAEDYALTETQYSNGSTSTHAFKAALSMAVAFSAILGRGGPLQALIMIIPGVILYELNRQIISRVSMDIGGSMSIFAFGGFFGTGVAIILYFLKQKKLVMEHPNYKSFKFNAVLAGIGSIFCWVFFPFLAMDARASIFIGYLGGVNTLYGISACVITTCALDGIIYGRLKIRDLIFSPIAGGIMVSTSSVMIFNPLEAILLGMIAAGFLVLFNLVDKKMAPNPIVSSNAALLFGVMGWLGGLASSVIRAILANGPSSFDYSALGAPYNLTDSRAQLSATFISIGIGFIGGVLTGLILLCFSSHHYQDNFTDDAYWLRFNDGISENIQSPKQQVQIFDNQYNIKGEHAYL